MGNGLKLFDKRFVNIVIIWKSTDSCANGIAAVTINPTFVFTEHQYYDYGADPTINVKYYELKCDFYSWKIQKMIMNTAFSPNL